MDSVTTTSSTLPMQDTAGVKTVGKKNLDRSDFMKLFITQMQHQDPLEPMDSTEMASQLAQFSSMEATMKMADNMEKLLEFQTSQNNLQLLTLIGREVQGNGNVMGVVDGQASTTRYTLPASADSCRVEIFDAAGRVVDTMELGYAAAGEHELSWDAKTPSGAVVPDGRYKYVVTATDALGQKVDADYRTTGRVTGVNFDAGRARVTVDKSITMNVSDVLVVQ